MDRLIEKFNRTVRLAQAAIFIERAWPKMAHSLCAGGLFLSFSWAGLWAPMPPAAKIGLLLTFSAAAVAPWRFVKTGKLNVTKDEAYARIDKNNGDPIKPAHTLGDRISQYSTADAEMLWDTHTRMVAEKWVDKLKAGSPQSDMPRRDPYKLRYAIALTTALTAVVAQDNLFERLSEAYQWSSTPIVVKKLQLRAWVTPPGDPDEAPLSMTHMTRDDTQGGQKLVAHKNSTLKIIVYDKKTTISLNGQNVPLTKEIIPGRGETGRPGFQYETKLVDAASVLKIENGPTWNFTVTQDQAPAVTIDAAGSDEKDPTLVIKCSTKDKQPIREGGVTITTPNPDPAAKPLPSSKIAPITLPSPNPCATK